MKYCKKSLTLEEQADLLIKRGMQADKNVMIEKLKVVNYYRLSAYWHTFRRTDEAKAYFQEGTSLDVVWDRYVFDRRLRLIVMDAIERVEIAIRTKAVYLHVLQFGPFGYLKKENLPTIRTENHHAFLGKIRDESKQKYEDFINHYHDKYKHENDLPLWMACELMSFGGTLTFFKHIPKQMKQGIAREFGIAPVVLESWLTTINFIRNLCAHHKRLWNRNIGEKVFKIPRKDTQWHSPVKISSDRMFGVLTLLGYLLKNYIAPQSSWEQRLLGLFHEHPKVPLSFMGFPDNWQESPLWQNRREIKVKSIVR